LSEPFTASAVFEFASLKAQGIALDWSRSRNFRLTVSGDGGIVIACLRDNTPRLAGANVDVYYLGKQETLRFQFSAQPWTGVAPIVQPLSPKLWLSVNPNPGYDLDVPNASVISSVGTAVGAFRVGRGVRDVQTTPSGQVWVSYQDDGIFSEDTLSKSGLACFSATGECLFQHNGRLAGDAFDYIVDCYALNVASDTETWIHYTAEQPRLLKRIDEMRVSQRWVLPQGPHRIAAFAVNATDSLLAIASRPQTPMSLEFLRLDGMSYQSVFPLDAYGKAILARRAFARSSRMYLMDSLFIYEIDLKVH